MLRTHSFSGHKYVGFQVKFSALNKSETFRNPNNTKCDLYRKIVVVNLTRLKVGDSTSELEEGTVTLTNILNKAYHIWALNCFEPFKFPGMDGIFPAMMQNV